MFINYSNPSGNAEGISDNSCPILINSCGYYRLRKQANLLTTRPHGRLDYQIIYIASGHGVFHFDDMDKPIIASAGNIIIYKPHEMQRYTYSGEDMTEIYWIHFTGNEIIELMSRYHIFPEQHMLNVGISSEYSALFSKIILELRAELDYNHDLTASLFLQLIIRFGRFQNQKAQKSANIDSVVIKAMEYLHTHYQENINIEEYIKREGLNTNSFYSKFHAHTSYSPLQYLVYIRIENAKNLLETTSYSINLVASLVGYEDALYFSRLFRKHTGCSPSEYRRKTMKIE